MSEDFLPKQAKTNPEVSEVGSTEAAAEDPCSSQAAQVTREEAIRFAQWRPVPLVLLG